MMIITDSASDITKQEAEEMDIRIVWLKTKFSDGDFPLETEEDFIHFFTNYYKISLLKRRNFRLPVSRLRRNFCSCTKKQKKKMRKCL